MNRRYIFSLSLISALGFALQPSSILAQQMSLKEQIVGTWAAVSWVQANMDGSKLLRFGSYPKGASVFDANGRFFIMFARPDPLKIVSGNPMKATPDENQSIAEGSIAYLGTFTVDEMDRSIILSIETSTFPNQIGSTQKWTIASITANELKISNFATLSGSTTNYVMRRDPTLARNERQHI
jgi:Lipocalin-like domain